LATLIEGHVDGDDGIDLRILLQDVNNITENDLIL